MSKARRVILINEFSDRSCPVTELAYDLGDYLLGDGHTTVMQLNLRTRYRPGGTRPQRVASLFLLHAALPWVLAYQKFRSLWRKERLIVISTTLPPLIHWHTAILGLILNLTVITWYQDAHPEIEARLLTAKGAGFLAAMLRWLDAKILRLMSGIIVLDQAMAELIVERLGTPRDPTLELAVIGPWSTFYGQGKALRPPGRRRDGLVKILYAGNYGFAHDLNPLRQALLSLSSKQRASVHLCFVGMNDLARQTIIELFTGIGVIVETLPRFAKVEELFNRMEQFDWGLVSLAHNQRGVASPSKALTYISQGLPLLYVGPKGTLADQWCEAGFGLRLGDFDFASLTNPLSLPQLSYNHIAPNPRTSGPHELQNFIQRIQSA